MSPVLAPPPPPFTPSTDPHSGSERRRWLLWLAVVLLSAAFHFVLLPRIPFLPSLPAPRKAVKINTVDSNKLQAIRKQWERSLLLGTDQPKSETAPRDARYFSDRNIRVEKEQKAKVTDIVPRSGALQTSELETPGDTPQKRSLRDLGVPLPLDSNPLGFRPPAQRGRESQTTRDARDSRAGSGADQNLDERDLPEGDRNLLNAQESVYYSFYARMYEQIGPIWKSLIRQVPYRRKIVQGDYVTQVDVVFDSDGNLREVRLLRSSGISEFDRAVEDAWKRIQRVPNPPAELIDERGEVHTGWSFSVQVGPGFNRDLDPVRHY